MLIEQSIALTIRASSCACSQTHSDTAQCLPANVAIMACCAMQALRLCFAAMLCNPACSGVYIHTLALPIWARTLCTWAGGAPAVEEAGRRCADADEAGLEACHCTAHADTGCAAAACDGDEAAAQSFGPFCARPAALQELQGRCACAFPFFNCVSAMNARVEETGLETV